MFNYKLEKYDIDGTRSKLFFKKKFTLNAEGDEVIVLKNMK